jgi:hypothetical protein
MADAYVAPMDPIFFMHHALIDALYTVYFHCAYDFSMTDAQRSQFIFKGCRTSNGNPLTGDSSVLMREFDQTTMAYHDSVTAKYFAGVPTTYYGLTDNTKLGASSYSYMFEGNLGLLYTTRCGRSSGRRARALSSSTTKGGLENEVVPMFRPENLVVADLQSAVAEAARSQGLTLEQGLEELEKLTLVAHDACVPGGVKDLPTNLTSRGSRFAQVSSHAFLLLQAIKSGQNPILISGWEEIVSTYLGCNVSGIIPSTNGVPA